MTTEMVTRADPLASTWLAAMKNTPAKAQRRKEKRKQEKYVTFRLRLTLRLGAFAGNFVTGVQFGTLTQRPASAFVCVNLRHLF